MESVGGGGGQWVEGKGRGGDKLGQLATYSESQNFTRVKSKYFRLRLFTPERTKDLIFIRLFDWKI